MNAKTIVIADDDRDLAAMLARRCRAMGLTPFTAHDSMTAVRMIDALSPDVVILDVNMPGGNGLAVCELIFSGDRLRCTPVIMLTGESRPETVRRCHEMCAYYVLKCPDVWRRVEPLLVELLEMPAGGNGGNRADAGDNVESDDGIDAPATAARTAPSATRDNALVDAVFAALVPSGAAAASARPSEQNIGQQAACACDAGSSEGDAAHEQSDANAEEYVAENPGDRSRWILCVDDDPDIARCLEMRLGEHGIAVRRAVEGMEGYRRAFTEPAEAILLDYEMPNGNGDYVLRRLKENPVTCDIPVVVLTGRRDKNIERTMYNLGAADFLTKPYSWEQLWKCLSRYVTPAVSNA